MENISIGSHIQFLYMTFKMGVFIQKALLSVYVIYYPVLHINIFLISCSKQLLMVPNWLLGEYNIMGKSEHNDLPSTVNMYWYLYSLNTLYYYFIVPTFILIQLLKDSCVHLPSTCIWLSFTSGRLSFSKHFFNSSRWISSSSVNSIACRLCLSSVITSGT